MKHTFMGSTKNTDRHLCWYNDFHKSRKGIFLLLRVAIADRFVSQLLQNLMMNYNKNVRPVKNASDALTVYFGASLCRLIDVDEVNQVLTTSLWLEMQWTDSKLVWNPKDYGGTRKIHISSDQIWTPDVVLYNNADGEPHISIVSLAMVDYLGTVIWMPPSIYKSFCAINIADFPYDSQKCEMKFGGWTNDGQTLDLQQISSDVNEKPEKKVDDSGTEYQFLKSGMGISFYHPSAEWDLLSVTSSRYAQIYPGCCGQLYYIDIRYTLILRRKAIFFTVMLTIPSMLITNMTPFVFLIPPIEHKMTFSISVFVAFSVFYLVLTQIIPPTSLVLPLIGKYLLFTLIMIFCCIIISVVNINIYRRQAFASEMSDWQRWLFVRTLPKYLRLKQLEYTEEEKEREMKEREARKARRMARRGRRVRSKPPTNDQSPIFQSKRLRLLSLVEMDETFRNKSAADAHSLFKRLSNAVQIIAAHFHNQNQESKITDEWRLMSLVIDRICLIIYLILNVAATIWFLLSCPTFFDERPELFGSPAHKPLSGDAINIISNYQT
ncbi:unnamed protein product, partial [Mesorhabditis belari]|uniref:Uncharacterized protein n=1 Tax=Mesorhabditis belari TaxID=2138241 RepID=A0AAF3J2C9_9BILA